MKYETLRVCVDNDLIGIGDWWKVIEPVYWSATIYDGPDEYERSLLQFSRPQRGIFAVHWYRAEVNNGGHHQFYSNTTGIVWKDALEAFRNMDAPEFASILEQSAGRLGGLPSLDRHNRNGQLEAFDPAFKDLDDRFYDAEKSLDLDGKIIAFIQSRPADFYFDGKITRALLPGN